MNRITDATLIKYKFSNGMPMLPFYNFLIRSHLNPTESKSVDITKRPCLKSLLTNVKMMKVKKADFVFFTSTLFNFKDEKGFFYNSLDGYYYDIYPNNSLIIENSDLFFEWRSTKKYKNISYINTYLEIISGLFSKIKKIIFPCSNKDINEFYVKTGGIVSHHRLEIDDIRIKIYSSFIKKLLKKIGCKVVFVNCASYGGLPLIITKVANEMGLRTVELQHGALDGEHRAYIGEEYFVKNNDYQKCLPQEIWLFGDYWNQFVTWNVKKKTIGNPQINFKKKMVQQAAITHDFLVIGQPEYQQDILRFTEGLSREMPSKKILLRLHTRDDRQVYERFVLKFSNIEISSSLTSLYDDIVRAEFIVGVCSTCLYEALIFNRTPIIIDCDNSRKRFNRKIGYWVSDASKINSKDLRKLNNMSCEEIWASNFEENVKRELDKYLH